MHREFYPTAHVAAVDNYPYGYKKTTAYFGTEFHPKKGYRTTFQTVNPSTGRLNAVKKSTYSDIYLMYKDEATGHIKHTGACIRGDNEQTNRAADFCSLHFELFTEKELEYLFLTFISAMKVSMIAAAMYAGADIEKLKPFYKKAVEAATEGLTALKNGYKIDLFPAMKVDIAAIDACKDPEFKPFVKIRETVWDGSIGGFRELTPEETANA